MKLLIVEDNLPLAELTADLLQSVDKDRHLFEAIALAPDLQTAIRCLPEFDAVLCDGAFPLRPGSPYVGEEWEVVYQETQRRGIRFVLYTGSSGALDNARDGKIPALAKPTATEEIYAALTNFPRSVTDRGYVRRSGTTED
jgi:CheY-like chemotaxis protein